MSNVSGRAVLRGSLIAAGICLAFAGANAFLSARATRRHPPKGRFVEVDGVRLHYVVMGEGAPLVILHGNGSMVADFLATDLVTMLAISHKVFIFDRPGYGHSQGGRRWWTAQRQASLFDRALTRLGVSGEIVMAHSWGTLVALTLCQIRACKGLVLLSGYYFPSMRLDAFAAGFPAVPGAGDLWRWTLGPLIGWLFSEPALGTVFSPSPVSRHFRARFPLGLALRPKSLRSMGVESALMVPMAYEISKNYSGLEIPVAIVAGQNDKMVSPAQAERLCEELPNASLVKLPNAGHMLHHTHASAILSALTRLENNIQDLA